jgi:hypothetical protein
VRLFTTVLIALTAFASACVDHSNDYEVITGFDIVPTDARTDRPHPDIHDAVEINDTSADDEAEAADAFDAFDIVSEDAPIDGMDAPGDEPSVDVPALADGASNGTCAGGDAAACPAAAHATVACESERCIYRCIAGYEDCDTLPANGCEVHLSDDPNHCGTCMTSCARGAPSSSPVCTAGSCGITCAPGFGNCDGDDSNGCEINLQTDSLNCALCGTVCQAIPNATATCVGGACRTPCNAGYSDCNSSTSDGCETPTGVDMNNCGMCGRTCSAGPNQSASCASGTCNVACNPGFGNCDGNATNGCETAISNNVNACGACGTVCVSGPNSHAECNTGVCSLVCDMGYADCDGSRANGCEVNLATSATHCGTCTTTCPGATNASAICASATCGTVCNAGFADCDSSSLNGCETNIGNDRNNCGGCGTICTGGTNATPVCTAGMCTLVCGPGFNDCDRDRANGCEINTTVSPLNCGTCGTVCPTSPNASATCSGGVCGIRCASGFLNCDGDTSNGCEYMGTACP